VDDWSTQELDYNWQTEIIATGKNGSFYAQKQLLL